MEQIQSLLAHVSVQTTEELIKRSGADSGAASHSAHAVCGKS